jgi:hypothetical protein
LSLVGVFLVTLLLVRKVIGQFVQLIEIVS